MRNDRPKIIRLLIIQEIVPHYRIPLLNKISQNASIKLTVISSDGGSEEAYGEPQETVNFTWIKLSRFKWRIGRFKIVLLHNFLRTVIKSKVNVIITTGNKSFVQNIFLNLFQLIFHYDLYYFQHAKNYENSSYIYELLQDLYQKYILCMLTNGLILYTQSEVDYLRLKNYPINKIFSVSNAIDTKSISENSLLINESLDEINSEIKASNSILFIGRLVEGKKLELLFDYYYGLKKYLKNLNLIIIGDGILRKTLESNHRDESIKFLGAIYDENIIAKYMRISKIVFNPGYTGLNILHSFAYGKPFITFISSYHKPEIHYLIDKVNGFIFHEDRYDENIEKIIELFLDNRYYEELSKNASSSAQFYTIEKMANNFVDIVSR
jgi:glycosyltransferase involved in cell wall biosynthesis